MRNIIKSTIALLLFTVCAYMFMTYQHDVNINAMNQLNSIYEEIKTIRVLIEADNQIVSVTAYHPRSRGINSDSNPAKTALMKKPIAGYTCAISDELFELGWLGKKIYIDGVGVRKATDRMSKTIKHKQIDICAPSLKVAKNFGIKKNVRAIIID